MYRGKRIVAVTPAGRQPTMAVLFKYIYELHRRGIIDEYQVWEHTVVDQDIGYLRNLAANNPFIKHIPSAMTINGNWTIHQFFKNCQDPNTVYIRFDDDIVFVDLNNFAKFLDFRIDNPQYFLCFANIINNAVLTHIHQRLGNFDNLPIIKYDCLDKNGLNRGEHAYSIHQTFMKKYNSGNLQDFHFKQWVLSQFERVSINCISWLGEEFALFGGAVDRNEEPWLTETKPKLINKPSCIFGEFIVAHLSFTPQRAWLSKRSRSERILSAYDRVATIETTEIDFSLVV